MTMPLVSATLATQLDTLVGNATNQATVATKWADAFHAYFSGAVGNGIPYTPASAPRVAMENKLVDPTATKATGKITITGDTGATCPAGTVWQRADGFTYAQDSEALLLAPGTAAAFITASVAGDTGNAPVSTSLSIAAPVAGINSPAVMTEAATGGSPMGGLSAGGAVAIAAGVQAYWGIVVSDVAVCFGSVPATPATRATPATGLPGLKAALEGAFAANTAASRSKAACFVEIANAIHTACLGGTVTKIVAGLPLVGPIL